MLNFDGMYTGIQRRVQRVCFEQENVRLCTEVRGRLRGHRSLGEDVLVPVGLAMLIALRTRGNRG